MTHRFLEDNGLQLLVRSHEVKEEGYEVAHDGYCVTVFSAPNYCDQMGNKVGAPLCMPISISSSVYSWEHLGSCAAALGSTLGRRFSLFVHAGARARRSVQGIVQGA